MAVRLITDAGRLAGRSGIGGPQSPRGGPRLQEALSGNYKMQLLYDGSVALNAEAPNLLANVAWLDASGLYRSGNNFGPTFMNMGATTVVISGCMAPRNWAYNPTAAQVADLAAKWEQLASLAPTDKYFVDSNVFSLFQFVFTVSGALTGVCVAMSN